MLAFAFAAVAMLAPISTACCLYLLLSRNGNAFSACEDSPQETISRQPVVRVVAVHTDWPTRS